jgi:Uma2 family endonuclease
MTMSTITSTPPMESPSLPFLSIRGGQRIVFRDVSHDTYQSLSRAMSEGEHIRLAYDGKDLEIMVTSNLHENWKDLFGKIVSAVTSWRQIPCVSNGEATWETTARGLQADLSYHFDPEKIRVAREALARGSMDQDDYPNPDMAIEIDMSGPRVDRPAIYAELRVAEVWRLNRKGFVIEHLQPDGTYAEVKESRFLGIPAEVIFEWLTADDRFDEAAWYRRLNQWAMGLGRLP